MFRIIRLCGPAALFGILLAALLFPRAVRAGVVGSPHDFSSTGPYYLTDTAWPIAPAGACSACHLPHFAADNTLWTRDLSPYSKTYSRNTTGTGKLDSRDGTFGTQNFLAPATVPCYDCHDYHVDTYIETTSIPKLTDFKSPHQPQNTLTGFRRDSLGSMTPFPHGPKPSGVSPGYYETNPPSSGNYGADNITNLNQTGGHYFKGDPQGAYNTGMDNGDKLPCSDCHDAHQWQSDGNWQAFFRKKWPTSTVLNNLGGLSARALASPLMANDSTPTNSRATESNGAYGRNLCIACHGTSDATGFPNRVRYSDINAAYDCSYQIVAPPDTVGEHDSSGTRFACVTCHPHNSVGSSCSQCHGYPPSDTATLAYPLDPRFIPQGGAFAVDSHARHFGQKTGVPNFSPYVYGCGVCHYGSAQGVNPKLLRHQNGFVSVEVDGLYTSAGTGMDNTNYFNPANPSFTGQLDNSTGAGGWGSPAPLRLGSNTCKNVYCHSAGRRTTAMVANSNDYRQPVWNSGPLHCNDCHGDPAITDNTDIRFGMPNYPNGGAGADNANSHATHVVANGYECTMCHAATMTGSRGSRAIRTDIKPSNHVNRVREVQFSGGPTGSYVGKTCTVSCHGNNPILWGGTVQGCISCHLSNAPDTDYYLSGVDNLYAANVTGNIDNTEWTYSGHGKPAGSNYDVSGFPPANFPGAVTPAGDPCYYCHTPYVPHDNAANPFRLKDQTGAASYLSVKGWNATCLVCHFHSTTPTADRPAGYGPDNTGGAVYQRVVAAQAFVDNAHYGTEHTSTYDGGQFCWDCHDPHGDRPNASTNNIFMIQGGTSRSGTAKGQLARATGGTQGILGAGGALTQNAPDFKAATTGTDYADNTSFRGICQVCHTQATTGHYRYNFGDGHNRTSRCTQCHLHNGAFAGTGGPDIEQYFDRSYNSPGATSGQYNFFDNSSHPLTISTDGSMTFGSPMENCLSCHGAQYKTGGVQRYSNECIKCHYENNGATHAQLDNNHMDKTIELATINTSNGLPTSRATINTIADYDAWCLQCHTSTSITLGGRSPSAAAGTLIGAAGFSNGRHAANSVGCIYCHATHGSGNAQLVRQNPYNRLTAGGTPLAFGAYPADNLSGGGYGTAQAILYRARVDNVSPNVFADADDENNFCNRACHMARTDATWSKDKILKRNDNTALYVTGGPPQYKKIYITNGLEYSNDNINSRMHGHINNEIISTDNMVRWYAALIGLTGPSRYRYPVTGTDNADTYDNNVNYTAAQFSLPFFPDYVDGSRDFPTGYSGYGRIKYRFTCSTCHNPHGTTLSNGIGADGYPDLRLLRNNPPALCNVCHR